MFAITVTTTLLGVTAMYLGLPLLLMSGLRDSNLEKVAKFMIFGGSLLAIASPLVFMWAEDLKLVSL